MENSEIIKAVSNATTLKAIELLYKDLAQPGVIQVGKALSTIVNFVNTTLSPLEYANYWSQQILRKNMAALRKKLKKYEIDEISSIPLEISKPLLDRLFYISYDELSELFINLLKRSCVKKEAHLAHPNFVNILSSISPDEARILSYLKGNSLNIISPYSIIETGHLGTEYDLENESGLFFSDLNDKANLMFPGNVGLYLTNLSSLGILTSPYERLDYDINDKGEIDNCGLDELSERFKVELHKEHEDLGGISMVRASKVEFTELGDFFLKAVM